mgnify:CR=1 FL=1
MRKLFFIPVAIALVIVLAFATTNAYRVPTADMDFTDGKDRPASVEKVVFEVSGLKCRGTANLFAGQIADVPGVLSFVAYARTHTAVIEYDPSLTSVSDIRAAFEKPIESEGEFYEVFKAVSQTER